ncbi:MAG TPA: radical SAM protein [Jatrophihabitans sp.]|nr:radical SAM protein [Jatrophihabitans sp.]
MRVALVDNLLLERRGDLFHFDTQPHLGLISLLSVIRAEGHHGTLLDPKLSLRRGSVALDAFMYEAFATEILHTQPDVVGFTSLGCNFIATARIAGHLKRVRPELPILLGGPHASILDVPILTRYPQFDVIVRGEAELTLGPVLERIRDHRPLDVAGVTYRNADGIQRTCDGPLVSDLDALPSPDYSAYPIQELNLPVLRVEAGRGCPFSCTFCSTATFFGRRYRLHSAERLCAELDRLHAAYGQTHFSLTHDLFTVNKAKVHEFCEAVDGRGYTWSCSARMDCVDPALLAHMAKAGCRSIYYGIETGSRRMQSVVSKKLDLDLFWPTLEHTREVGIEATTSFITGYPQETLADQSDTLDLIGEQWRRTPAGVVIQLHLLTPEPGTALLTQYRSELAWDGHISDFNLPALEHDDDAAMRADPEVFVNHHYYRGELPRRRNVLVTAMHPVLYRLGMPVQRHLLARYPGFSLAAFFAELADWRDREAYELAPGAELLVRYATAAWGAGDHLTSMIRYMLAATAPELQLATSRFAPMPQAEAALDDACLALSPRVALLAGVHDCPAILRLLTEAERPELVTVPEQFRNPAENFVLVPAPGQRLRTISLSPDAVRLLDLLSAPTGRRELADALGVAADDRAGFESILDSFVSAGILENAPAPAFPLARGSFRLAAPGVRLSHPTPLATSGSKETHPR